MCCFSQPVEYVSATQIFARPTEKERQFVVYSMTLQAKDELSMILPLFTPEKSAEDAVRFVNLEEYANFFDDLKRGFPAPASDRSRGLGGGGFGGLGAAPLKVVDVGSFEASFVPKLADFSRLDERFRLSESVWDALPQYKKCGFAVFKLKSGERKIHPMAFEFPRADERAIFFPTVHIHDGKVHKKAEFDHTLYCQVASEQTPRALMHWRESPKLAREFMELKKAKDLILGERHVYKKELRGNLPNQDTFV